MMGYRPDAPTERSGGAGEIVAGVAIGLLVGLLWELLTISTDWRLGFSPPVWEIVVGWIGLSAFSAFVLSVVAVAGLLLYSYNKITRNPQSYDARKDVFRARTKVAAFNIGLGVLMAFGGVVLWVFSRTGPEFDEYSGLARFGVFAGVLAGVAAYFYLKKGPEPPF